MKVRAGANAVAGGIAQGRQNPGLVSKAGGWVPSDSHLLSEPQVPAALSSRGHLPGLGMWLRSSVLLELAGLGLRRRVPILLGFQVFLHNSELEKSFFSDPVSSRKRSFCLILQNSQKCSLACQPQLKGKATWILCCKGF